ncbi:MAG: hypothetical protein IIA73_03970 [Proteobacteria bacterium]|nr:hypothetical protein [Pseudomonadota bacterium]
MFASDQVKAKSKVEVELVLSDGTALKGHLFLSVQQRILDSLNDERAFVPFEDAENVLTVLNKSAITRIKPVDQGMDHAAPISPHIGH